jgi:hypothetical protein
MGQCVSCAAPPRADSYRPGSGDLDLHSSPCGQSKRAAGGEQQRQKLATKKNQKITTKGKGRGEGGGAGEDASDATGRTQQGLEPRRNFARSRSEADVSRSTGARSVWEDGNYFGRGDKCSGGGGGGDGDKEGGGGAPLTLLQASARRIARHYEASDGDQERIYAKLRSFAKTMPQRATSAAPGSVVRGAARTVSRAPNALTLLAHSSHPTHWRSRRGQRLSHLAFVLRPNLRPSY